MWYWEVVELSRRIVLTGCIAVIMPGTPGQIMVGVIISSTYMKLYAYFQPYLSDSDDTLAEVRYFTLRYFHGV